MELKQKKRLIGGVVLLGIVLLQLPFLFHSKRPAAEAKIATKIPVPPPAPKRQVPTSNQSAQLAIPALKPTVKKAPEKKAVVASQTIKKVRDQQLVKKAIKKTAAAKKPDRVAKKRTNSAKKAPKIQAKVVQRSLKNKKSPSQKANSMATVAWSIQLGVFSSEKNAKILLKNLRAKGYEAYMRSMTRKGKRLLVVYAGPEVSLSKVKKMQARIAKNMHVNGFVKQYQL